MNMSNSGGRESGGGKKSDYIVNPWHGDKHGLLPDTAVLACVYELQTMMSETVEALFFHRTEQHDALWRCWDVMDEHAADLVAGRVSCQELYNRLSEREGIAAQCPRAGTEEEACRHLFSVLCWSRTLFQGPGPFIAPGLLTEEAYTQVLEEKSRTMKGWKKEAIANKTEILRVAEEFGMSPRPTGLGPHSWGASCPGTGHHFWMDTREDKFGCPYHGRGGGPEELRAFLSLREQQITEQRQRDRELLQKREEELRRKRKRKLKRKRNTPSKGGHRKTKGG